MLIYCISHVRTDILVYIYIYIVYAASFTCEFRRDDWLNNLLLYYYYDYITCLQTRDTATYFSTRCRLLSLYSPMNPPFLSQCVNYSDNSVAKIVSRTDGYWERKGWGSSPTDFEVGEDRASPSWPCVRSRVCLFILASVFPLLFVFIRGRHSRRRFGCLCPHL